MKKYISLDKKSKKVQKEYYSGLRHTWNGLNPVTRTVPNGKAYSRSKAKQEEHKIGREFIDGFDVDVFCFTYSMMKCGLYY